MAEVLPFRGIRFDPGRVGTPELVVSPPYDVITPDLQKRLYARSPHNIVRIDYGEDLPGDGATENRYTRAAEFLGIWLREGVLRQDPEPSLYYTEEEYSGELGEPKSRRGVFAAVRLEDPDSGLYHPHEKTLAGPKADRLKLMRACPANLSPIFALYDDPDLRALGDLERRASLEPPTTTVRSDDGRLTRLWRVRDAEAVAGFGASLRGKGFFIADGHHRYETALGYRDIMRRDHPGWQGSEPWNHVMMYLSNLWSPGLTILPTHRAVHGLPRLDTGAFLLELQNDFELEEVREGVPGLLEKMRAARGGRPVFGLGTQSPKTLWLLSLKETARWPDLVGSRAPEVLRRLDVTILHGLILERILGIDQKAQEEQRNLEYIKDSWDLIQALADGRCQLGFFLNPTRIEQVKAVAEAGERMPQKSTFFYPKVLTGLVINPLADLTETA